MKKLAITIGDPGGIGPEVVLKALIRLKAEGLRLKDNIFVVFCDKVVMEEAIDLLRSFQPTVTSPPGMVTLPPIDLKSLLPDIKYIEPEALAEIEKSHSGDTIYLIDTGLLKTFKKCEPSKEGGIVSVEYIKRAVELAMKGMVHAVVTAPISKTSLKMAGYNWPGHTEMLKEFTGARDVAMLFYAPPEGEVRELRVLLHTIHIPLRDVPSKITEEGILKTIHLARTGAELFGIEDPVIGVAGLNPHAGEEGLFGDEEKKAILPAIKRAQGEGLRVTGPVPPDVIFYKALHGDYDIIVSMYHDQGLAPLKLIAFDRAVNITVGLPIIRTSPDHGTAYDIAWKGIANPSSMMEAIKIGLRVKKVATGL